MGQYIEARDVRAAIEDFTVRLEQKLPEAGGSNRLMLEAYRAIEEVLMPVFQKSHFFAEEGRPA